MWRLRYSVIHSSAFTASEIPRDVRRGVYLDVCSPLRCTQQRARHLASARLAPTMSEPASRRPRYHNAQRPLPRALPRALPRLASPPAAAYDEDDSLAAASAAPLAAPSLAATPSGDTDMADAADAALRIDFDDDAAALLHAGDLDDAGFADELADDFDDDDVR